MVLANYLAMCMCTDVYIVHNITVWYKILMREVWRVGTRKHKFDEEYCEWLINKNTSNSLIL